MPCRSILIYVLYQTDNTWTPTILYFIVLCWSDPYHLPTPTLTPILQLQLVLVLVPVVAVVVVVVAVWRQRLRDSCSTNLVLLVRMQSNQTTHNLYCTHLSWFGIYWLSPHLFLTFLCLLSISLPSASLPSLLFLGTGDESAFILAEKAKTTVKGDWHFIAFPRYFVHWLFNFILSAVMIATPPVCQYVRVTAAINQWVPICSPLSVYHTCWRVFTFFLRIMPHSITFIPTLSPSLSVLS